MVMSKLSEDSLTPVVPADRGHLSPLITDKQSLSQRTEFMSLYTGRLHTIRTSQEV